MQKAEFDKFAHEYYTMHEKNIWLSSESPKFFAEYKIRDVFELATERREKPQRRLDFGSRIGTSAPHFKRFFPDASLGCLNVSEKCLSVGRSHFPEIANFRSFYDVRIPAHDDSFDPIFAACIFHHIPHYAQYFVLAIGGTDA